MNFHLDQCLRRDPTALDRVSHPRQQPPRDCQYVILSRQSIPASAASVAQRAGVAADCYEVGEGGRGWSEARAKPRGFLRGLSPTPATHFKCNNLLPHPGSNAHSVAIDPLSDYSLVVSDYLQATFVIEVLL